MKKNYTAPVVEIIEYEVEDVLLTSTVGTGFKGLIFDLGEGEAEAVSLATWFE